VQRYAIERPSALRGRAPFCRFLKRVADMLYSVATRFKGGLFVNRVLSSFAGACCGGIDDVAWLRATLMTQRQLHAFSRCSTTQRSGAERPFCRFLKRVADLIFL